MRTRAISIFFTAVAAGLLLGAAPALPAQEASAADVPTVAVLDFTGLMVGEGGNSAPLGKAVSSMLITELIGRPGLRVIERDQLQNLLTEQSLSLSGRVDESRAIEIGRMLGVQYMLFGQVTSIANMLRMDMRAVDVETSEVLEVQKLTGQTEELLDVVVRMADTFAGKLELEPPSSRPEVETIPVQATIEFSRGLDFEDKGDVEQAREHYRKALEIHPGHKNAEMALERLDSGGTE